MLVHNLLSNYKKLDRNLHLANRFRRLVRTGYLREVDSEDGMRAAAGVVHAGASSRAVDVSSLHQLLHVAVVLNQVLRQI